VEWGELGDVVMGWFVWLVVVESQYQPRAKSDRKKVVSATPLFFRSLTFTPKHSHGVHYRWDCIKYSTRNVEVPLERTAIAYYPDQSKRAKF